MKERLAFLEKAFEPLFQVLEEPARRQGMTPMELLQRMCKQMEEPDGDAMNGRMP